MLSNYLANKSSLIGKALGPRCENSFSARIRAGCTSRKGAPLPPKPQFAIRRPLGASPVAGCDRREKRSSRRNHATTSTFPFRILIYVKDTKGTPVRLLKTNPHGIFATYNPLLPGEYTFEMKDPKNIYFFDTMKIGIQEHNAGNIEIVSKEML
jgi:hypothetical protein